MAHTNQQRSRFPVILVLAIFLLACVLGYIAKDAVQSGLTLQQSVADAFGRYDDPQAYSPQHSRDF
jgi:hypothetical protein